jgi:hypothetical protein
LEGPTAFSASGLNFSACPVDSSMIWYANWLGSRGRFFDRSRHDAFSMAGGEPESTMLKFQTDPLPRPRLNTSADPGGKPGVL